MFIRTLCAITQLSPPSITILSWKQLEAKDDDFNYHIDFITRCANLRADNYHISNSDFHKATGSWYMGKPRNKHAYYLSKMMINI